MTRPIVAALLAMVLPCAAARAGAKQDREHGDSAEEVGVGVDMGVMFAPHERKLVRGVLRRAPRQGALSARGLAKKNNGCLPPGRRKSVTSSVAPFTQRS